MEPEFLIKEYSQEFEHKLLALEKESVQGGWIKLKMIRPSFKSRSEVFQNHQIFTAVSSQGEIQGVSAGSIIPIVMNGRTFNIGIGYDLRVSKRWRKMGLARQFGRHLIESYFKKSDVHHFITTAKKDNAAVLKAALGIETEQWTDYRFQYLTVPINRLYDIKSPNQKAQNFSIGLLSEKERLHKFYTIHKKSGIGIWKTFETYHLKIVRINPAVKLLIKLKNLLQHSTSVLPKEGDELRFVTLFNINNDNISALPGLKDDLQKMYVHYCNIICRKHDPVYEACKKIAINAYEYMLINTLGIKPDDYVTLDVRCL